MNQYDEALKKETAFLGQPRGVGTLSFVQLCSSFSNYAMNAVMIYYLYANAPAGLGFDNWKGDRNGINRRKRKRIQYPISVLAEKKQNRLVFIFRVDCLHR